MYMYIHCTAHNISYRHSFLGLKNVAYQLGPLLFLVHSSIDYAKQSVYIDIHMCSCCESMHHIHVQCMYMYNHIENKTIFIHEEGNTVLHADTLYMYVILSIHCISYDVNVP